VYQTQLDSVSSFISKIVSPFLTEILLFLIFDGKQINTFTEINYQRESQKTEWIFGANIYSSNFDENENATLQRDQRSYLLRYLSTTSMTFRQLDLRNRLEADYNTDLAFPLPKVVFTIQSISGFSGRIGRWFRL
jgi:iron complex outermembrane receptor protein